MVRTAKTKTRKKKSALKTAKDNAWKAFSIYIRTRDCIRFRNNLEEGMCVTCKGIFPFKKLQAGHFVPGRKNNVLLEERVVYTQCWKCNAPSHLGGLAGNYIEYFIFMEHEVGREKIEELRALKYGTKVMKAFDWNLEEQKFKDKTEALIEKFNADNA